MTIRFKPWQPVSVLELRLGLNQEFTGVLGVFERGFLCGDVGGIGRFESPPPE